jgi:hypothetical protein
MRKLIFASAVLVGIAASIAPASAQCTYTMNDVGRFHGYLSGPCNGAALGYAGAYRPHYNTAAGFNPTANTPKPAPQVNGHASGCDALCQSKCERTWQRLGFRNVGACIAKWGKLNSAGTAASCEAAIRAGGPQHMRAC